MTPPPTTRRFLGISFKSRAVFDVSIDGLPSGSPGSIAELEPTAMMHFSKAMVWSPDSLFTTNSLFDMNEASP